MTTYTCPRCGTGRLIKDGKTAGRKQRWACKGPNGYCYTTTDPAADAVINQRGDRVKGSRPL